MIRTENGTHRAMIRHFQLFGFVFVVLALSFGSLAAKAAPQVLKGSEGMTRSRINSINLKTGVVIASVIDGGTTTLKESGGGQSFRFFVKDAALLNSLKEDEQIFADFKTQEVFTGAGANGQVARLGGILTDSFGKSSAGGANQQPAKFGEPVGPSGGTNLQQQKVANPLGPADSAKFGNATNPSFGNAGGANQQPAKFGEPVGPSGGTNLQQQKVANPLGPADSAKFGNATNPGQPNCQITGINAATGVVTAKYLSTGQTFQFTVQNAALFRSLNVGQRFFANFNSRQVSLDGKIFTGIQSVGGALPN